MQKKDMYAKSWYTSKKKSYASKYFGKKYFSICKTIAKTLTDMLFFYPIIVTYVNFLIIYKFLVIVSNRKNPADFKNT